jgi:hypothetical protein
LRIQGESIYRVHALVWRTTSPFRGFYRDLTAFVREVSSQQFSDAVMVQ